jgi:uncharacterized protein YcfL
MKRGSRLALVTLVAVSLAGCKSATETVVEQTVKVAKDTSKGIEDGIQKGRKEGQSADDAAIVTNYDELRGKGAITLYAVRPGETPARAIVDFAVDNQSDRPLRVSKLEVLALDAEGFVKRPLSPVAEVTVPPKAKEKVSVTFDAKPNALKKVRVWGIEYDVIGQKP